MKSKEWQSILIMVAMGVCGTCSVLQATSPVEGPTLTVHVRNEAAASVDTLREGEKAAEMIFGRSGIHCQWVSEPVTLEDPHEAAPYFQSSSSSDIQLKVLPREMSDRLSLPTGVTGLAPGDGPDRLMVYVFYDGVLELAQREAQRQAAGIKKGEVARHATEAQILGEVIAHELGHILLNLSEHTRTGIMRGQWDLNDLRQIAEGRLTFTKQQGQVLRAEVARRDGRQRMLNASR
jgi:hypothetical protein